MKFQRFSLTSFILLLCCGSHVSAETDNVIGSIGSQELHESDVLHSLGQLDGAAKAALAQDPAALGRLVRSLLVQKLILQEALEKKWDQEPAVIPLLQSARDALLTDSYLQSVCKPPGDYPDTAILQKAYEAGRESLMVPRSYRIAQIYIAAPEGTSQTELSKSGIRLESVSQQLGRPGASFGLIARSMSEEKDSASRDGEIGWLSEKQIQPEILAQLPKLKINSVSAPIRLKDGWHILKVLDVREPFTPIFDQVRAQLAQRLRTDKTRENIQSYMAKMLQNHPVAVNEVALSKLLNDTARQTSNTSP